MANSSLLHLIESLRSRTVAGDEMLWERSGESEFVLRLTSPALTVMLSEDATVEPPKMKVSVETPELANPDENHQVVDEFLPDSPGYDDVAVLLSAAKQRSASINDVLEQVAIALESNTGPVGMANEALPEETRTSVVSEADTTDWAKAVTGEKPVEPETASDEIALNPPSEEQKKTFFNRIKGNWKRHHEQGFDELAIDELGDYYYRFTEQGTTKSLSPKPAFRLVLLACDPDMNKVEVSREAISGTMRQIEVLKLSDNEMIGHAKHDHQLLQYRRAP